VQRRDRRLRLLVRLHLDEAETLRSTGVPVHDDLRRFNGAVRLKHLEQVTVGHAVTQVPDIQFLTHANSSPNKKTPSVSGGSQGRTAEPRSSDYPCLKLERGRLNNLKNVVCAGEALGRRRRLRACEDNGRSHSARLMACHTSPSRTETGGIRNVESQGYSTTQSAPRLWQAIPFTIS